MCNKMVEICENCKHMDNLYVSGMGLCEFLKHKNEDTLIFEVVNHVGDYCPFYIPVNSFKEPEVLNFLDDACEGKLHLDLEKFKGLPDDYGVKEGKKSIERVRKNMVESLNTRTIILKEKYPNGVGLRYLMETVFDTVDDDALSVVVDFKGINFLCNSVLQEYVYQKSLLDTNVIELNKCEIVSNMLKIAQDRYDKFIEEKYTDRLDRIMEDDSVHLNDLDDLF